MFDLVSQIRSWRECLAREGVYSLSDLDELEVHLREEMATLTRQGLSEQEAFTVAGMRVGNSEDLAQEFAKVNAGLVFKRRLFWMGIGVLGAGLVAYVAAALSKGATLLGASAGLRGSTLGIMAESIHILALVLAILGVLGAVRRYSGPLTSPAWLQSTWGRVGLFVGLAALSLTLLACPLLLTAGTARVLGPRDMGQMLLVSAYANLLWPIIGSLLLIGLFMKAWSPICASPES